MPAPAPGRDMEQMARIINRTKHAFHPSRGTKIMTAQLGNDAGMYGAAKLAADNIKNGAE